MSFKDNIKDLYERSMGLNLLDAEGNAVINLRGFDYKFRIGENGWLYLTGLPKKLTSAKKIVVPGIFDILACKMPKDIEELDLGNVLYWLDERPIEYNKLNKLVGKELLLSKFITESLEITQYWYMSGHKKSKIMTYMLNDIFMIVNPECEIDFPKLAYMDKTYSYYFPTGKYKAADNYLCITNSLALGDIGYKQLIEDRNKDLQAERKRIIAKRKRDIKAGKAFSIWLGWMYSYSDGKIKCYGNLSLTQYLGTISNRPDWAF